MDRRKVCVCGAAGRMGQRLIHLISIDTELQLIGAVESPVHPKLGMDAGTVASVEPLGVKLVGFEDLTESPDCIIDFSHASGAESAISFCLKKNTPLVMATTGLNEALVERLRAVAVSIPLVWAPNMSLAVNLTMKLVEVAASALKSKSVDVEIIERHHRFKADSPSGTALKFGELVASQMGQLGHRHGREGITGTRPQSEIGYHAVRAGDNPGEHTIVFGLMGETIELRVAASNRDCYAMGAIAAAKFLMDQPPGMYSMQDVLGFASSPSQLIV